MKTKRIWVLFLALILIGCNSAEEQDQTEEDFHFAISPATSTISSALALCANNSISDTGQFRVSELFPSQFNSKEHDLVIQIGESAPKFTLSAQIATESFSIVSHLSKSPKSFSSIDIANIFSGQVINWAEFDEAEGLIQVWLSTDSDGSHRFLEEQILNGQSLTSNAKIASSPAHLLFEIQQDEEAIAILPDAWLDSSVSSVSLSGSLPILAASEHKSGVAIAALIACLQSGEGQELISEIYTP